jgi:hypothetical protein
MAGLLDGLFDPSSYGGQQGGLLAMIQAALQAQQNAPAAAPAPQVAPDPSVFNTGAQPDPMTANAPSAGAIPQGLPMAAPPTPAAPAASFADRFNAAPTSPAFGAGAAPIFATPAGVPGNPALPAPAAAPPVVAQDDDEEDTPVAPKAASPIAVGNVQMPRVGPAAAFTPDPAALPANSQPTQGQGLPNVAPPTPPDLGDRFMTGLKNFEHGGSLLGSIIAGTTGKRNDAYGEAQDQAAQSANVTERALLTKGVDPAVAHAAVQPGNTELLKTLVDQNFGPKTLTSLGEGYVTDKRGNVTRAYTPEDKTPASVLEYNYYKDNLAPGQKPMDYATFSDAKARAAAQNPGTTQVLGRGGELFHKDADGKIVIDHKNTVTAPADDVSQETIDYLADRTRMGDPAVKIGYGRNPGMIARIDATAQQREAAGIPVSDAAKNVTDNKVTLSARGSAERKLGTINTNNEFYGNNALGALDIAEKASADVPRTDYPSVNKALNAYRTGTGDPKTVALGAALNTVVNDYAKFTGGGVGTDSLRGHAEEILNGAHSPEQLSAIVHMMRLEIKRGQQSPEMVRSTFDKLYAPAGSAAPAAPQAAAPATPSAPRIDPAAVEMEMKRRGLLK